MGRQPTDRFWFPHRSVERREVGGYATVRSWVALDRKPTFTDANVAGCFAPIFGHSWPPVRRPEAVNHRKALRPKLLMISKTRKPESSFAFRNRADGRRSPMNHRKARDWTSKKRNRS